jgi:hypothetical protein
MRDERSVVVNRRRLAVPLLIVFACGAVLAAQEAGPIRDKLDAARASYDEEVAEADDFFDVILREKEGEARNVGDFSLLSRIHAEREVFARQLEPLKVPGVEEYLATVAKARQELEAAHVQAAKEYAQAGKTADAKAVNAALEELKRPGAGASAAVAAPAETAKDDRRIWVQPDGYFVHGAGKDWFENWDKGNKPPNLLTETQRTKEFIELQGRHHPVTVRLYADRALLKAEGQVGFKPLYKGGWGEAAE